MTTESRELTIWIENDGSLYRRQTLPIIKNLQKKIAKGTYDPKKALILWKHLADSGAKSYAKEFGGVYHEMFSVADRKAAAIELAASYDEHLREKPVTPSRKKSQAKRVTEYFGNPKKRRKRAKRLSTGKRRVSGLTIVKKTRKVTRVKRNPIVSKVPKQIIEAMQDNGVAMYYQFGSKGVSKPLQGLFTTNKNKGTKFASKYNAAAVARAIVPYLDKRLKWIKVIPA
jgi:hypothetical protein